MGTTCRGLVFDELGMEAASGLFPAVTASFAKLRLNLGIVIVPN